MSEESTYSMTSYVRRQATIAAIFNVVLNPLIAWLGHRGTASLPLGGSNGIAVDLAVTSLVLSLLVALFMTRGLREQLEAGHVTTSDGAPRVEGWLARLPGRGWVLGLLLGGAAAVVAVVACGLLVLVGVSEVSLGAYLVLKALYCGLLGYLVARWVLLRQVLDASRVGGPRRPLP